jgi:hypothetical protein
VANQTTLEGLVPAVFSSRAQVETALLELRGLGLSDAQLGVAVPDPVNHRLDEEVAGHADILGEEEIKGAATGFILGASLGSIAGVGLMALAVGGLGPLGVGGILAGAGFGAVWGMGLGATAGLAAKVHSEEEVSHWSEIPLSHTDILVLVRAGDKAAEAHDVMVRHGGRCFCRLDRVDRSSAMGPRAGSAGG